MLEYSWTTITDEADMTDLKDKAVPTVNVLEHSSKYAAHCGSCKKLLKDGKYTLTYELGEYRFLLGEKRRAVCECGAETEIPILLDEEKDASEMSKIISKDAKSCDGIPAFPFINFSEFPSMVLQ